MNTLEKNSRTPLRCKHRSPVVNFLGKKVGTQLRRSSNCQIADLLPQGEHARRLKEASSFHVFPVAKTPPEKPFSKIIDPFEAALIERLHLPLIGSPTLFQRPSTPQHSSTQSAWTIDDVSSLQPANVEPHETQFHDSPDPDNEAKAQSAISSYFKEQQIVPSPVDCPLRGQRIIPSEYNLNTPISKPGRRIRDNIAQTDLSFPPTLPKELEEVLAPYFIFNQNQQCSSTLEHVSQNCSIGATDHDFRDASLRRKLFDYQSGLCTEDNFAERLAVSSPAPQSPEVLNYKPVLLDEPFHNSKLFESMDKSSFGSLSPIVKSSSPQNLNTLEKNSRTPLRCKHRSPVVNFLGKKVGTQLSRSSNCQIADLLPQGEHARRLKEASSFHVFPVAKTPPEKPFSKIINPFEAALIERLHLPLIGSPTLFQRPSTPQHSSTQFAWTIDDVSSLQPANVEPHETQFHDSPDPDYEAKAQSAISSYFKEQQIVPSPIDCPLRSQRIILSEYNLNTPISKPGRRIRDNIAQTVLSFPPILPKELEEVLAPYFIFNQNQQCSSTLEHVSQNCSIGATDHDVRDASLRRKLFDYQSGLCTEDTFAERNNCILTISSPAPQSPEVLNYKPVLLDEPFHNSKLFESADKSSFGSLSPIVKSSSPRNLKRKSRSSKINNSVSRPFTYLYENYRCPQMFENLNSPHLRNSPICRFTTPEKILLRRSSSPYGLSDGISKDSMVDVRISSLLVDTAKRPRPSIEIDLFGEETRDMDEDDIQFSQLSAISNISSESDTPRSKRRSASRKNLSQSFSIQCRSNNEGDAEDFCNENKFKQQYQTSLKANNGLLTDADHNGQCEQVLSEHSIFYRTDSGFNEMTTSTTQYDKFQLEKAALNLSSREETVNKYALENSTADSDVKTNRRRLISLSLSLQLLLTKFTNARSSSLCCRLKIVE